MGRYAEGNLPTLNLSRDPPVLTLPDGSSLLFSSPAWEAWMSTATRIAIAHPAQSFVVYRARRATKADSPTYWNASVYVTRKAITVYLGKDAALTAKKLHEVGHTLAERVAHHHEMLRFRRFPKRVQLTREQLRAIFGTLSLDDIRAQLIRLQALDDESARVARACLDLLAVITLPQEGQDEGDEEDEAGDEQERTASQE